MTPASTDPVAEADAKISGFPKDAATVPDNLRKSQEAGVCKLYTTTYPLCDPKCANTEKCYGLCDTGTCETLPVPTSMGNLTVQGLKVASNGNTELTLTPINNTYESAGDATDLSYPPCAAGEDVTVSGGADDATKFTVKSNCIDPLVVTSTPPIPFEANKKSTVTWTPPTVAGKSKIIVRFDISHHGGLKGLILCESEDTGSVEVDGALIAGLIQLGTAGYPVVRVTRIATGEADSGSGKATLNVQSIVETPLKVPGIDSCGEDKDCVDSTAGKTCTARKCQ